MKISSSPEYSGFNPDDAFALSRATVLLNGQELKYVVAADDERGVAVVWKMGRDGKFIRKQDGEGFQTEIRRGNVCIVMPGLEKVFPFAGL
jgi:hypothetical protein